MVNVVLDFSLKLLPKLNSDLIREALPSFSQCRCICSCALLHVLHIDQNMGIL